MRGLCTRIVLIAGLLLVFGLAPVRATPLDDANNFIAARQYDRAISTLESVVSGGNATAEVYNQLGTAYHWKKDFDNALKNYRLASERDKKYILSPLPILVHFKRYDEMIQIGETVLAQGGRDVAAFSGTLNAYYALERKSDYERILKMLRAHRYASAYETDYQRYLLAKAEVRAGRGDAAFGYISKMKDKSLLQYMRTSGDFEPIAKDPRFDKMTRQ